MTRAPERVQRRVRWHVQCRVRFRGFAAVALVILCAMPQRAASQQTTDAIAEAKRLRDMHDYRAAAAALVPYLRLYPDDAGVHWMRAQLLEWSGQRAAAQKEYERTRALTPTATPAADTLARHAADLAGAWITTGVRGYTDDQPLRSAAVAIDAGRYVSDDVAVTGNAGVAHYTAPDAAPAAASTVASAQAGLRIHHDGRSLGGDIGFEHASRVRSNDMIGNVWAALSTHDGIALAGSVSRAGYHWTVASIDTSIMVTTAEISIARESATGIAGRAAVRNERFDDANTIHGAYVWLLVPVAGGVRAGYAGEYRDAVESRWDGADYEPYYTPENVRIHSIIGEWSWRDFHNEVRANAGIGISAQESAPFLLNPSGRQIGFTPRTFTPWNASVSLMRRVTYRSSLRAELEHHETAFYHATTLQLGSTLLIH
jgi:hypothetical protein